MLFTESRLDGLALWRRSTDEEMPEVVNVDFDDNVHLDGATATHVFDVELTEVPGGFGIQNYHLRLDSQGGHSEIGTYFDGDGNPALNLPETAERGNWPVTLHYWQAAAPALTWVPNGSRREASRLL